SRRDAEEMEVEGSIGEENCAQHAKEGKHGQDEEMAEMGNAHRRVDLGLVPGLEEGRFGWNGLIRIKGRRFGFVVSHPFRGQKLGSFDCAQERKGWGTRHLWLAGMAFGGGVLRVEGVLLGEGTHAMPVFFLRGPEVIGVVFGLDFPECEVESQVSEARPGAPAPALARVVARSSSAGVFRLARFGLAGPGSWPLILSPDERGKDGAPGAESASRLSGASLPLLEA